MAKSLEQKLQIQPNYKLLTINAPIDFINNFNNADYQLVANDKLKEYDQIHWFVLNKKSLDENLGRIIDLLKSNMILWIYYPKGSSKLQTDLNRDKGWDTLMNFPTKLTFISLISFNDVWSTFGCRLQTEKDIKKDQAPKERPILEYIDATTKVVRLPDDFDNLLKQNPSEEIYFNQLSFSNRKEYVEWIITAKQAETRTKRLDGAIGKLKNKWKNPTTKP